MQKYTIGFYLYVALKQRKLKYSGRIQNSVYLLEEESRQWFAGHPKAVVWSMKTLIWVSVTQGFACDDSVVINLCFMNFLYVCNILFKKLKKKKYKHFEFIK